MKAGSEETLEKNLDSTFEAISQLHSESVYEIQSHLDYLQGREFKTSYEDGKLVCVFTSSRVLGQNEWQPLIHSQTPLRLLEKGGKRSLAIDFSGFSNVSLDFFNHPEFTFKGSLKKLRGEAYHQAKEFFFRVFIPTTKELTICSIVESLSVKTRGIEYWSGLISLEVKGRTFHLFRCSNDEKKEHYLVIDSLEKMSIQEFDLSVESILLAYAFVTGDWHKENTYVFLSDEETFETVRIASWDNKQRSLLSSYRPVPREIEQQLMGVMPTKMMTPSVFNNLANLLLKSRQFIRAVSLLVEANTLSLHLRASLYAVVLEAMTNLIAEEHKASLTPIPDKQVAGEIISTLKEALAPYAGRISPYGLETINKKLDVLNSPLNKDKLLKPFEFLGIPLQEKDKRCISMRNDFLHGRMPERKDGGEIVRFSLEQIMLSLHCSVNSLILKYAGYSGPVTYYPAVNEINKGVPLSEHPVRFI